MRKLRMSIAALLLCLLTLGVGSTANATSSQVVAGSSVERRGDVFFLNGSRLTPDQARGLAVDFSTSQLGQVGDPNAMALASSGCSSITTIVQSKNALGGLLWTHYVRVNWCLNGTIVTSISPPQSTPSITTLGTVNGWTFEGVRSTSQWNYSGNGQMWRTTTSAQYKYCALKVGCIQNIFPWSRHDVYYSGFSSVASGK